MSKIQWLGDPVSDCKANTDNRNKCSLLASALAPGGSGPWTLYRNQCLEYLCTQGTMPSASDLPAPPPLYEMYPWGVEASETFILQQELNKKLKADGLCPIKEDGKVGASTCGAAKKYGVSLPSCSGHAATTPAPCGVTPKTEPVPPPVAAITPTKKDIPWVPILLVGGVIAAVATVFALSPSAVLSRANPARGPSRMAKPDAQGRHPKYKHLVMFEIEPHYGSYILTALGHRGDALISSDDAQHMFGKDFDAGFGYLTDEYLQLLEERAKDNPRGKKTGKKVATRAASRRLQKWKDSELNLNVKLPLGMVVMTPGVQTRVTSGEAGVALMRHMSKDWGDVSQEDWNANLRALRDGDRVLSSYSTKNGTKFWIITEADRSVTTLLLPEEY